MHAGLLRGCLLPRLPWPLTVPQAPRQEPPAPQKGEMGPRHPRGWGALGQPPERQWVGGRRMPQHRGRGSSSSPARSPCIRRWSPLELPPHPPKQGRREGRRAARSVGLPGSPRFPPAAPLCRQPARAAAGSRQRLPAGSWSDRPLLWEPPSPPRPLLSISGRRPQMFGKTNCTGISSQVFPQFCPL